MISFNTENIQSLVNVVSPKHVLTLQNNSLRIVPLTQTKRWQRIAAWFGCGPLSLRNIAEFIRNNNTTMLRTLGDQAPLFYENIGRRCHHYNARKFFKIPAVVLAALDENVPASPKDATYPTVERSLNCTKTEASSDITIAENTFSSTETSHKPQRYGHALDTLRKMGHILSENLSYKNWFVRKFVNNQKGVEASALGMHPTRKCHTSLPNLPQAVLPNILQYLPTQAVNNLRLASPSKAIKSTTAEIIQQRAEEFGYDGNDVTESNQYLKDLFDAFDGVLATSNRVQHAAAKTFDFLKGILEAHQLKHPAECLLPCLVYEKESKGTKLDYENTLRNIQNMSLPAFLQFMDYLYRNPLESRLRDDSNKALLPIFKIFTKPFTPAEALSDETINQLQSVLSQGISNHHVTLVNLILSSGYIPCESSLQQAIKLNDLVMLKELLNHGAIPDETCFDLAIGKDSPEMLRQILATPVGLKQADEVTLLHDAVRKGNLAVVQVLKEFDIDSSYFHGGFLTSPLTEAIIKGRVDMVRVLLTFKDAPINNCFAHHIHPPLVMACNAKNIPIGTRAQIVKLLLEHGADPLIPSRTGAKPVDYARVLNLGDEIITLLSPKDGSKQN